VVGGATFNHSRQFAKGRYLDGYRIELIEAD